MNPEELEQIQVMQGGGGEEMPPEMMGGEEQVPPEEIPAEGEEAMVEDPSMLGMDDASQAVPDEMKTPEDDIWDFTEPAPPEENDMHIQALQGLVLDYIDFTTGIKNDKMLDKPIQSNILSQMATAISSLVPLLPNTAEQDMKRAEMQADFTMKQQEMEFKAQEHEMNMEFKREEAALKLQQQSEQSELKLQQANQQLEHKEREHRHNIVQKDESHKQGLEQQKQAAQVKQSRNDSK